MEPSFEQSALVHGIETVANEDRTAIFACFYYMTNIHGVDADSDGPREMMIKTTDHKTYKLYCFGFDNPIKFEEMEALSRSVPFQRNFLDYSYDPLITFQPVEYSYKGAVCVTISSKDYQRDQQKSKELRVNAANGKSDLESFLRSGIMDCFMPKAEQ